MSYSKTKTSEKKLGTKIIKAYAKNKYILIAVVGLKFFSYF